MAHGHKSDEKVVFVGDSRVRKRAVPVSKVPPDYSAYPGKSEAFIPNFLLKEWMVGVVVLVGFLVTISDSSTAWLSGRPNECGLYPNARLVFLVPVSISEITICFEGLRCAWNRWRTWNRLWRAYACPVLGYG